MRTLVFIIMMVRVVRSQTWDPNLNGDEETYMQFTAHWKKEIISWAKECIFEITTNLYQVDQINWVAGNDLRHAIGVVMGRALEMHRQQADMYRRMKRVVENKFTWLRPELSGTYPQLGPAGQNVVVEPGVGHFDPLEYNREWAMGGKRTFNDYKPHVYIVALEYITKRESEIEQLVKLLTLYTAEDEVGRVNPYHLPIAQSFWSMWTGYSKKYNSPYLGNWRRQRPSQGPEDARSNEEDKKQEQEEAFKEKMREEYYKKNGKNNK
ncbi:uncharacterized protein LOC133532648 [Cydia pomonella]|uniref:uncharacterized protein LOC133532648 n=1 Tax=Cydia pomonella TaxID=82600 RepID=UPI002ADDB693|nr:uncharacterized protein LOC133532648 [Cydia pomonella]